MKILMECPVRSDTIVHVDLLRTCTELYTQCVLYTCTCMYMYMWIYCTELHTVSIYMYMYVHVHVCIYAHVHVCTVDLLY